MRALVLHEFGGSLVLTQTNTPDPGPGQMLVAVRASGVKPLDLKIKAGQAAHAKVRPRRYWASTWRVRWPSSARA
jgi:NADPH2:quinone reductase